MANKSSSHQDKNFKEQEQDFKEQLLKQPYIHKATDWVTQNLKIIGIVAGIILLLLVIGKAWTSYEKGLDQKASALEGKIMQLHQDALEASSDSTEEGATEKAEKLYQDTIAGYQQIFDEYSGTGSAERALFFLGGIEYERGNFVQARENFLLYLKKYAKGTFVLNAKESLAYISEQEGEYQKALDAFKELENSISDAEKPELQLAIARNYRALGQKEDAIKIYQSIVDSSTSVSVKNQAREALDIVQSDQEFPPPVKAEEASPESVEATQPEAEAAPETSPVEEAQPETEAAPEASAVEEAQPETEAAPEASPVEEVQPETEAAPEASPVEEVQPETEAAPEASPVEEVQPETEAAPEASPVEDAQPETEAAPEASPVEGTN